MMPTTIIPKANLLDNGTSSTVNAPLQAPIKEQESSSVVLQPIIEQAIEPPPSQDPAPKPKKPKKTKRIKQKSS